VSDSENMIAACARQCIRVLRRFKAVVRRLGRPCDKLSLSHGYPGTSLCACSSAATHSRGLGSPHRGPQTRGPGPRSGAAGQLGGSSGSLQGRERLKCSRHDSCAVKKRAADTVSTRKGHCHVSPKPAGHTLGFLHTRSQTRSQAIYAGSPSIGAKPGGGGRDTPSCEVTRSRW